MIHTPLKQRCIPGLLRFYGNQQYFYQLYHLLESNNRWSQITSFSGLCTNRALRSGFLIQPLSIMSRFAYRLDTQGILTISGEKIRDWLRSHFEAGGMRLCISVNKLQFKIKSFFSLPGYHYVIHDCRFYDQTLFLLAHACSQVPRSYWLISSLNVYLFNQSYGYLSQPQTCRRRYTFNIKIYLFEVQTKEEASQRN